MWKFRSMVVNADQLKAQLARQNEMQGGVTFKMKNDPRVTRVGRFIRKYSIDELPQFWNVLRGDMSLVGPRPPVPKEVALYSPEDRQRLLAQPGLTCLWQVGGRSTIDFAGQVRLDVAYIQSSSVWLDLKLLVQTVPAVLFGKGAF
jgi:lipopolysaccharide/colanic/teichoic acid biosynthesis glycosyltransferase